MDDLKFAAGHPFHQSDRALQLNVGGDTDDTVYNTLNANFVLRHLDVCIQDESAGDSFLVLLATGGGPYAFFAGGVGSGHVGSFWQSWDGYLVVHPGEGIEFRTNGVSDTFSLVGSGYWEASACNDHFS